MIDTSFLSNFQKNYPKETEELKFIIITINDLYIHYNFYQDNIQTQSKIFSSFGKNVLSITYAISNEFNEFKENDLSQLKELEFLFLEIGDKLGKS